MRGFARTLLYHTNTSLVFHVIGDRTCASRLGFYTGGAAVRLYPWEEHEPSVDWIPNRHYAGAYPLVKLIAPQILPEHVRRVIFFDTDMYFNADVAELWNHFDRFAAAQALAMTENMSRWYGGRMTRWPALRRGFNGGLLMMDLEKLRRQRWRDVWRAELLQPLLTLRKTDLGEMDVLNVVIKRRPELIYELSCSWNVQWRRRRTKCFTDIKVLHWNFPGKQIKRENLQRRVRDVYDKLHNLRLV